MTRERTEKTMKMDGIPVVTIAVDLFFKADSPSLRRCN
jgi:hypothetical protein